ncbi:hypothetical protein PDQ75_24910 [Bacillus cereus group sp. Bc015]|uniref:hypothetical protein n=1 Tax=Bacillus cereus group sp. Bc015 TaxID=3018123 RepID=UPI0022E31FA0|nr:hypothetical protein [Bacillus cereus group sp. Bc015]MDA2738397.1 hypothetical protein [Bacillus cereus group sp. Bc015]
MENNVMKEMLEMMKEMKKEMNERFDKIDTRMESLESKVDDVLLEARKFHGVACVEFDSIKKDTKVIKEQTENQTSSIEYLAGITGIHEMKLNRKGKN